MIKTRVNSDLTKNKLNSLLNQDTANNNSSTT